MTAPTDKREAILERLKAVYEGLVADVHGKVYRNQISIPEKARPAFVILDADEVADESAYGRKRPANGPIIMQMTPESYLLLSNDAKNVGTDLSAWRGKVLKAVLEDETLVALCHDGDIRYEGFETGLAVGRSMEAEARISFTFRYVLRPANFA